MKYSVSKRLFENVNNYRVEYISIAEVGDKTVIVDDVGVMTDINDFFFMCKRWARDKNYVLVSWEDDIGACRYFYKGKSNNCIEAENEIQAVFNTCELLLDKILKA